MPPIVPDQPQPRPGPAAVAPGPATDGTGSAAGGQVPQRSGDVRRSKRAPLALAAAVAAGWAALVSYLPVAVVIGAAQFIEDSASPGGATRMGLAGWLLGHGVPIGTSGGPVGLAPLALALLAAWRVARAGVHVSRAIRPRNYGSLRRALAAAATVGVAYGLFGALAAVVVDNGGLTVSPVRAGLNFTAFGSVAALIGAVHTTGALGVVAGRMPAVLRDGLRTGVVASALLLGAGAAAAGLAVATGGGEASEMIGAYRTGVVGQAGITLVSAAYAPNAAVWAASYLLGPGFAVGAESVVRTTEVTLGALPAVPLLAGLPHGPVGGYGAALLTVPVFAGIVAGWLFARRSAQSGATGSYAIRSEPPTLRAATSDSTPSGWAGLLAAAVLGGPVAGALLGSAARLSGGPVGGGRLAEIGPVAWHVAAAATVLVALGALVGAVAGRILTSR